MSDRTPEEERAYREGVVDSTLTDHTRRLDAINGHLADVAANTEELTEAVRQGLGKLQEEGRAARLAVKVAADALELEAKRRREELETAAAAVAAAAALIDAKQARKDRRFTRRQQIAALAIGILAIVATIYFSHAAKHPPAPAATVTHTTGR